MEGLVNIVKSTEVCNGNDRVIVKLSGFCNLLHFLQRVE